LVFQHHIPSPDTRCCWCSRLSGMAN
jgi:hypothetical protein